jgi:Sigma-70 region 2
VSPNKAGRGVNQHTTIAPVSPTMSGLAHWSAAPPAKTRRLLFCDSVGFAKPCILTVHWFGEFQTRKYFRDVHGKPGADGIFIMDGISAVYQEPQEPPSRPTNYLSAPIPGAPVPSNLSVYRWRKSWILSAESLSRLMLFAKADDRRRDRPDLYELDKAPLWPLRNSCPWRKDWRKHWRRGRSRGIWPDPRHCTGYRWSKIALALHFQPLVLSMANRRGWQHLPYDDRVAAAFLGLAEAIHRFDAATHRNGLTAYAIWWIRKSLQRLAYSERRQPQEDHESYGFAEGEFGPGKPMSFWPRVYPLIRYDENTYRRRPQFINIGDCVVENIKLGAPADDNDDVEHVGTSFAIWSPINPEAQLLFKEAAWEKYKYRSAAEIAQMCDSQIDAATVNAARREWRERKKRNRVAIAPPTPPKALVAFEMASLPATVFAPV